MNTPSFIKRLIASASPSERARSSRKVRHALDLCHGLLSERGEVSGTAHARDALAAYRELSDAGVEGFLAGLVAEFSPDPPEVARAADGYRADPTQENLSALQRAVEPPRQELFRRLNRAQGGTATLVALRHRLLAGLKTHADWQVIDTDLVHLFNSWFNRGFLSLERIDWHTPAIVLEQLIAYEAVHAIGSWKDLRRRLEADRRCFAFFHPALPGQPIIFIEVALTKGMSTKVQPLLDANALVSDPQSADTATFYSITSCQEGLRGIPFGNLLIKQVAQELGQEFPRIKHFATLSPVPGFRAWLNGVAQSHSADAAAKPLLETLLLLESDNWLHGKSSARLPTSLTSLCAYYLLNAKRGSEPADPVARFHLGNGAQLEQINWLADTSKTGIERSAGFMVNYVYRLSAVEENHESYSREHRVIAARHLRALARECPLSQTAAK